MPVGITATAGLAGNGDWPIRCPTDGEMGRPSDKLWFIMAISALVRAPAILTVGIWLLTYLPSARAISDPLEPLNRAAFAFNELLLNYMVDPIGGLTQVWVLPRVREAAGNIYLNLSEPEFIATNLLQGNFADSWVSLERVVVNSTIGIGGVFDPATSLGLVARQTEPSEAVCALGVPPGPYLVIPVVGSANLNETAVLTTLWVGHLYILSLISTWLVTADIVIDASVAAALLRHSADPLHEDSSDPYIVQRYQYYQDLESACTMPQGMKAPW